jgi:hypothetical protein
VYQQTALKPAGKYRQASRPTPTNATHDNFVLETCDSGIKPIIELFRQQTGEASEYGANAREIDSTMIRPRGFIIRPPW